MTPFETIQTQLRDYGLYSGDIDGEKGPLFDHAWKKLIDGYHRCNAAPYIKPVTATGWSWDQTEGRLYRDGKPIAVGYSGKGEGRNNPAMQGVKGVGVIPAGEWKIGKPKTSAKTGPVVMDLTPVGHDALGRSAFQIHGDNATHTASSGCIILPRAIREMIANSGDTTLKVVN